MHARRRLLAFVPVALGSVVPFPVRAREGDSIEHSPPGYRYTEVEPAGSVLRARLQVSRLGTIPLIRPIETLIEEGESTLEAARAGTVRSIDVTLGLQPTGVIGGALGIRGTFDADSIDQYLERQGAVPIGPSDGAERGTYRLQADPIGIRITPNEIAIGFGRDTRMGLAHAMRAHRGLVTDAPAEAESTLPTVDYDRPAVATVAIGHDLRTHLLERLRQEVPGAGASLDEVQSIGCSVDPGPRRTAVQYSVGVPNADALDVIDALEATLDRLTEPTAARASRHGQVAANTVSITYTVPTRQFWRLHRPIPFEGLLAQGRAHITTSVRRAHDPHRGQHR